jgi:hypothetical protein
VVRAGTALARCYVVVVTSTSSAFDDTRLGLEQRQWRVGGKKCTLRTSLSRRIAIGPGSGYASTLVVSFVIFSGLPVGRIKSEDSDIESYLLIF